MASEQANSKFPAKIYYKALEEVIEQHFGSSYKDCEIKIGAGSSKGDNYGGDVFRVTVKHPTQETLSLIVKTPPVNAARREQFMSHEIFTREAKFYDEIIGMFTKFQRDKGIDIEKEGFFEVAKCFRTLSKEPHEELFLEDIKVGGFDMFDRFKDLTADHVFCIMKTLGKFHAISLALKDQQPEVMAPYREMIDIWFLRDEDGMKAIVDWFESLKKQGLEVLQTFTNEDLIKRVEKFLEKDLLTILKGIARGELAEPYAVLCHGDCWNNNMMFREENGIPVECRLLDWQVMRYATPVCDLSYFLFGSTTEELRNKHYNDFMDVYYESLSSFLKKLGSDPTKVFPRQAFDDQLKCFASFGLIMGMFLLPIITSKEAVDLDEMADKFEKEEENAANNQSKASATNTLFTSRMRGVFQHMYDFGYI